MELMVIALAAGAAPILALAAWRLLERARAADAQAAQAELRLDIARRALGMMARELETPGLSLLGLAARLPAEAAPLIETEARRLLALSEEVGDYAAHPLGARGLRDGRIPLGLLLREVVAEVALPMGEGARHWRIPPEADALTLLADRRALRRVLTQILTRAVRETRSGDRIALRIVRAAETVALVVEDEGAGLAHGDLEGGEGTRGLSLGLSVARELMRAHGGELTLESAPRIGTRSWLTLPRARVLEDQAVG
jgi:signal transduction histidine kinase